MSERADMQQPERERGRVVVILKALTPPSMEDFDELIAKSRKQARRAGLKRSDVAAAVKKARGRR